MSTYQTNGFAAHYPAVMGAKNGCPQATGDYTILCSGSNGGKATNGIIYEGAKTKFREITDGTSKTFLLGENSWDHLSHRVWVAGRAGSASYAGRNLMYSINSFSLPFMTSTSATSATCVINDVSFGSKHPGGAHFGLADGAARFVSENAELAVLKAYASRAGRSLGETTTELP
jgi:hypothetical protein